MESDISATWPERPTAQEDAWRKQPWRLLDVLTSHPVRGGFEADSQVWQLGSIAVSPVVVQAVVAPRQKPGRARMDVDHWVLACCDASATRVTTGRCDLEVPAGVPFLWSMGKYSMAEAFESERMPVDGVAIYIPGPVLRGIAPRLDPASVTVLDTPFGHLLGDYMLALVRRLPDLAAHELPRLGRAVLGMVGTCVTPSAGQVAVGSTQNALARLERAQQAIGQNLRSPALGPKILCRLIGVSRSNLYRLFENAGGVAKYIQRQRLLEAHKILRDPTNQLAISAVAEQLCFTSASGFSRAFRNEFGHAPNQVRAGTEASLAPVPVQRIRPPARAARAANAFRESTRHAANRNQPNRTPA